MLRQFLHLSGVIAFAFLITAGDRPAGAAGFLYMPGTSCQRCGCGYGAGYHAPLLRGPMSCGGCCAASACGYEVGEPTSIDQPVSPVVAPPPAPSPATQMVVPTPLQELAAPLSATQFDVSTLVPQPAASTFVPPPPAMLMDWAPVVTPTPMANIAPARPLFDAPVQP